MNTSPEFFVRTRSGIRDLDNPGNFLLMDTVPTDDGMALDTRFLNGVAVRLIVIENVRDSFPRVATFAPPGITFAKTHRGV
ncbi:hypothetical protein NPIL_311111 [Nephila pilipes]|uniref:Uncharacterized protein n=1 Tax=Nephila pilipes TaxID=299642 RepID=A0A8X6PUQ8_NEPPI|nr:hypothetical protein NPIL_311111 [Nephila pilipes]